MVSLKRGANCSSVGNRVTNQNRQNCGQNLLDNIIEQNIRAKLRIVLFSTK